MTTQKRDIIQLRSGKPADPQATGRRGFIKAAGLSATGLTLAAMASALSVAPAAADGGRGRTRAFIRAVKRARVFDLSHMWDEKSPIAGPNPPYNIELNANHANAADDPNGTRGTFGDNNQLSFTSEVQDWSGQHGAPSIDATGHIGQDGKLFGNVDGAAATSNPLGLGRSGVGANLDVAHYPVDLLVNRGVLLDVARLVNGNATPLPPAFEITGQHLDAAARAQRVRIERGDTVLIRTGWDKFFTSDPEKYKGAESAGVGVNGAQYLIDKGARVVGNDTLTFEVRPPIAFPPTVPQFQVFPVHMQLLARNGINIIENYFLDEIAAAKVHEFVVVVPPLKIRGGTGSALRSFALAPTESGGGDDDDD